MNEHKNIITIEDEIKEFSDKPVKSSALYKTVKELESNAVPDASEASVGDVLSLDEDKKPTWSAPSGGGVTIVEAENYDAGGGYIHTHIKMNCEDLYAAAKKGFVVALQTDNENIAGIIAYPILNAFDYNGAYTFTSINATFSGQTGGYPDYGGD